jgi:hypothetical protein
MKKFFRLFAFTFFVFLAAVSLYPGPVFSQAPKESQQGPVSGFLRDLILYSQIQGIKVELRGDGLAAGFRSFFLADPQRLVFDFPGVLSSFPKKFIEVGHPLLKDIRFGQHPDRLRMVLTFPSANRPPYRIEREAGALAIVIGKVEKVIEDGRKPGEAEKKKGNETRPPEESAPAAQPQPAGAPPAIPAGEKEPPAPPEKPGPEKPAARMEPAPRITLDLADADIRDVLSKIADAAKRQIVVSPEVQGTLTLRLIDVPWDQALDAVLSIYNLKRADEGNLIRILPRDKS